MEQYPEISTQPEFRQELLRLRNMYDSVRALKATGAALLSSSLLLLWWLSCRKALQLLSNSSCLALFVRNAPQ
jgi:hypothetical protein